jgi:predicted DNA-binding protein
MELSKKTTILLSPEVHARLTDLAARKGTSLGHLVREACAVQYGVMDTATRLEAVAALAALSLPVGSTREMKAESVPSVESLLPSVGPRLAPGQ